MKSKNGSGSKEFNLLSWISSQFFSTHLTVVKRMFYFLKGLQRYCNLQGRPFSRKSNYDHHLLFLHFNLQIYPDFNCYILIKQFDHTPSIIHLLHPLLFHFPSSLCSNFPSTCSTHAFLSLEYRLYTPLYIPKTN
jgi:hypothetical protein